MKAYKILWVLPNAKLAAPQHKTNKPMSLMDKIFASIMSLFVLYFTTRNFF